MRLEPLANAVDTVHRRTETDRTAFDVYQAEIDPPVISLDTNHVGVDPNPSAFDIGQAQVGAFANAFDVDQASVKLVSIRRPTCQRDIVPSQSCSSR